MKTIAKAALIVGAVAAIATGVGAVVGGTAFLAATGVSLATVSAIGTVAGLVGSVAGMLSKPKGTVAGSLTDFKLDPAATIPMMFGRTYNGGNVVHRDSWGADNQYQGFIVVYSGCGPVGSFEGFYADRDLITFDAAGAAIGAAFGPGGKGPWLHFRHQLGRTPEPAALMPPVAGMPGWTAAHKLSGYFAGAMVMKFDKDGKKFQGGVPKTGVVGEGVRAWDPRKDSTYPGGNGPCRMDDPSTWPTTRNPYLVGLQFAIGWHENGYLVGGVGTRGSSVIVADYVAAANIAEANGWEVSGVRATGDPKWDTLKLILEAGGGTPIWLGACLSCEISAPRVSVARLTIDDLRGPISIVGTQTRRGGRVNTGIPVYRSEPHGWEMIPASAIPIATFVAEDGGERTKEITFNLVAKLDQAAQLTAYSLCNGREFGPIEVKLDPRWIGLQPGMAVDMDIPRAGLENQQCVIIARTIEPGTGLVSVTLRSETKEKHAFSLGARAAAPPTPSLGAPNYDQAATNYETAGQAALYIRNSAPRNVTLSAEIGLQNTLTSTRFDVAPWTLYNVTDTANAIPNPEGTGNTRTITATADYAFPYIVQNGAKVIRVIAKRSDTDWFAIYAEQAAGASATWFNLATGAIGQNSLSGTMRPLGGGWFECSIRPAAVTNNVGFGPRKASGDFTSAVGSSVYVARSVIGEATANTATVHVGPHLRDYPDRSLEIVGVDLDGVPLGQNVLVYYDDQTRADVTPEYQYTLDYELAVNSTLHPYRHYVGLIPTPNAGEGATGGDPPPYPGGGGYCVTEDTLVQVYVPGEGDQEVPAGKLAAGMLVRTLREDDMAPGLWPVSAVAVVPCSDVWTYSDGSRSLTGSAGHRLWIDGDWRRLDVVGKPANPCNVVKISVPGARTYMSNGFLSHNIKMNDN